MAYGAFNRSGYGRALALGGATAAGAAAALGGIALPTFYATAVGAAGALMLTLLGIGGLRQQRRETLPPGVPLLLLLLGWSALVTLLAPVFFSRMVVNTAKGRAQLLAGYVTPSNIAQLLYLALGVCVVVFLARSPHSRPELVGLLVFTTTILSFWRYLHGEVGVPFPEGLFDNSPTLAFIETAPGGEERFRGILSEPSSLAASCLITIAYGSSRAPRVRGWRRAGILAVVAAAAYMGSISTSTTFVVAAAVVAAMAAGSLLSSVLFRRARVTVTAAVMACVALMAAIWLLPTVVDYVSATVGDKVGTTSYDERSASNTDAYNLFFDTYGYGVGLGSNRASSFLPGLLSTTGLVGTVLFAAVVAMLISRTASIPAYRPVLWALVTMLVLKLVAGPDLSDPSGVMWMSLGLLSHAAVRAAPPPKDLAYQPANPGFPDPAPVGYGSR
jgi:hypothetical protein